MKKPVLNQTLTLTLTLGLPAKHSDVFHCLHKGMFLVSSRYRGVAASQQSWANPRVKVAFMKHNST